MISVAIDGPAGAGKSTIAKLLAKKLGATYIDSGAMYRAITYKAIKNNVDLEDEHALLELTLDSNIELFQEQTNQLVYIDGANVTEEIRSPQVSQRVSIVAKHPKVREQMVNLQRLFAEKASVVMDGRDIGTTVLPNADVKIFLTATVVERAKRRHKELVQKGYTPDFSSILQDIEVRDRLDSERASSPLVQAEDAILIDATTLPINEVVEQIYALTLKYLQH